MAPRINPGRLWGSLESLGAFGALDGGGLTRLALSEADAKARAFFMAEARQSGFEVLVDRVGNMMALRKGGEGGLPLVMAGSHLDSQPSGGRYDGALGVAAGLEVLRALDDFGLETKRPVGAANFTNEEGARFRPALTGSSVLCGSLPLEEALGTADDRGASLGEALASSGFNGRDSLLGPEGLYAAFELHIEQGPVLESEGVDIGAVSGIFGISWLEISFQGPGGHSGTTPMRGRADPVLGAARLAEIVSRLGLEGGDSARATVGRLEISPNSVNSIASEAKAHVEFRAPTGPEVERLAMEAAKGAASIAEDLGLSFSARETFRLPPTVFDEGAVEAVRRAARDLGLSCRLISSGAGHDAANLARLAPTAMIFVPCKGGRSHVPEESIEPAWAEAGANALLLSVLSKANE